VLLLLLVGGRARNSARAIGSQTLNGSSGNDCLVAGGGAGTTNTLQGGGGADVFIGARGAVNNYSGCETTGTS
jgi:Ca2+-binding RTX toxin-like protein